MTKTKRQLRAEAVERLKDCRYHTLADYVRAMLGWGHEPHFEGCRDALIDLLTDEEPPDGNVISKKAVREIIKRHFNRVAIVDDGSGKPIEWRDDLVCNVGFDFSSIADEIADMVERDYVRRIDFEVKDAEVADLRDERDRMRADYERIYQFQVVETERNHWKSNAERYKAERDELKAENKLLRERKCPGYNPDRHYCEFHAQDFKLNSKTVRTLKQDRKKLIDILTCIGVEVRDDEFGLSFMYDNYHNLGRENERLEEQLIETRKSRGHWQRVAGKHASEIQQLKRGLEAERELARMWPRFEDGRPVRVGDEFWWDHSAHRVGRIMLYEMGFRLENKERTCFTHVYRYGEPADRPPLKAKDGQPIEEGTLLYGEDGRAWLVESINHADKYPIEGSCGGEFKRLKAEWLTHEKPDTFGVCQNGGKGAAAQALQPLLKEPGDIGGTPLLELGA